MASPLKTTELFQVASASVRVDDTTYLRMLLNLREKSSSFRDGHALAKPSYVTRPRSRASLAISSSDLNLSPSGPRSYWKVHGPSFGFSPPGPSMPPSTDTNSVITILPIKLPPFRECGRNTRPHLLHERPGAISTPP